MTATLAHLFAAPIEIRIGKRKLVMSPLTWDDLAELNQFMQSQHMQRVHDPAVKELPDSDRAKLIAHIADVADQLTLDADPLDESEAAKISRRITQMPAFNAQIFLLGLKHRHPEITLEEVIEGMQDESMVESMLSALERLNRTADNGKKKKTTRAKKRAGKKKKVKSR